MYKILIILSLSFILKFSIAYSQSIEKNIVLNVQHIPVAKALKIIAKFAKFNIIISDDVKGYLSLYLRNTNWCQAFNTILKIKGLIKQRVGDITIISSAKIVLDYAKKQLEAITAIKNLMPLKSQIFHIKYGKAIYYYDAIKNNHSLISKHDIIILSKRTNSIFVKDNAEKLATIQAYLSKTDIPVKQIEIATRIVTVDKSFEKQLGVKWNLYATSHRDANGHSANNEFKLDFGASAIGNTPPARLAIATLAKNILIGLELSAIEAEGGGEILSNPRLLTADQQEAIIEQGTEIPYNESTKSGAAAIAFKKALLSLKVTPQITPKHKILLHLEISQDAKSSDTSAGDTPLIDTRHIKTNVLVNNGETAVLGGIYERSKTQNITRIPFISAIPVLGNLFKKLSTKESRKELLIFVTPHIINEE